MNGENSTSTNRRWTAAELRKLPPHERDAILEAAAALAEDEYRNDPELVCRSIDTAGGQMPLTTRKLGEILLHIYDFPFDAAIYLPEVIRYEADTPCIVSGGVNDEASFHQTCLQNGFKNWLNVAVVSDTCDDVSEKTESSLIAAFNEDCKEGGWLWKMMNYRQPESP